MPQYFAIGVAVAMEAAAFWLFCHPTSDFISNCCIGLLFFGGCILIVHLADHEGTNK